MFVPLAGLALICSPVYCGYVQVRQAQVTPIATEIFDSDTTNGEAAPVLPPSEPTALTAVAASSLLSYMPEAIEDLPPAVDTSQSSPTEAAPSDLQAALVTSATYDEVAAPTTPAAAPSSLIDDDSDGPQYLSTDDVPMTAATSAAAVTSAPGAATIPAASTITAAPSSPPCESYFGCNIFYQSVFVYYWPQESQNSACLSTMSAGPPPISPIGLDIVTPSVYVVFPSISAFDGCSQVGPTFAMQTASFAPGELSTIGPDNATQSFDFGDLPCPPASVSWDSSKPYAPLMAPPQYLFDLDPAFKNCIAGASQGIDPPAPLQPTGDISGLGGPGRGHHPRQKRALEHAHVTPWAAQKTT